MTLIKIILAMNKLFDKTFKRFKFMMEDIIRKYTVNFLIINMSILCLIDMIWRYKVYILLGLVLYEIIDRCLRSYKIYSDNYYVAKKYVKKVEIVEDYADREFKKTNKKGIGNLKNKVVRHASELVNEIEAEEYINNILNEYDMEFEKVDDLIVKRKRDEDLEYILGDYDDDFIIDEGLIKKKK